MTTKGMTGGWRVLTILAGLGLLCIAVGGVVLWVTGFEMLRLFLIEGLPVFFEYADEERHIPGRLAGTLILAAPVISGISGIWLLRRGFTQNPVGDS